MCVCVCVGGERGGAQRQLGVLGMLPPKIFKLKTSEMAINASITVNTNVNF